MPYTLLKTNGKTLTVVQDGTIDTTTDLTFVGQNYAGYGIAHNQNFLKLLENFANNLQPIKPLTGQIWYDTANKRLRVYSGTKFKSLSVLEVGTTKPSGMNLGDLFFDVTSNNERLYAYNGVDWTAIGPFATTIVTSGSGTVVTKVMDISQNPQYVIKNEIVSDNIPLSTTATVLSNSVAFEPEVADSLSNNFPFIHPGLNLPIDSSFQELYPALANNNTGITAVYNENSDRVDGFTFWGTAATALGLVDGTGRLLRADNIIFRSDLLDGTTYPLVVGDDEGITIGDQRVLKIHITNSNDANISVINGQKLNINGKTPSGGTYTNFIYFDWADDVKILPNPTLPISIGSTGTGNSFANLYAINVRSSQVVSDAMNAENLSANTATISILTATTASISNLNVTNLSSFNLFSTIVNGSQIYENGIRVLTSATVSDYAFTEIEGVSNQITVTGTAGTATIGLANSITVNTLTATTLSANAVFSGGLPVLTLATLPASGVYQVDGTPNQIVSTSTGTLVSLSLSNNLQIDSLSATGTVKILGSDALTTSTGVVSFSAGTTGFTPTTSTSGVIVLTGSLLPRAGGTGVRTGSELTGIPYANGTGTWTVATSNQVIGAIGATPVANAINATNASISVTRANTDKGTNIATTNFVHNILPYGAIIMWYGSVVSIPSGWNICDGTNGTPNLTDRFIIGAGDSYAVGSTGGSKDATLVSHTHNVSVTLNDPGHQHDSTFGERNIVGPFGNVPGINNNGFGSNGNIDYDNNRFLTSSTQTGITATATAASTGTSATDANLPPYYALCYIMKVTGQ